MAKLIYLRRLLSIAFVISASSVIVSYWQFRYDDEHSLVLDNYEAATSSRLIVAERSRSAIKPVEPTASRSAIKPIDAATSRSAIKPIDATSRSAFKPIDATTSRSAIKLGDSTTGRATRVYPPSRPTDAAFIDANFGELKAILTKQKQLTGYWAKTHEMMKLRRPVFSTQSWRLQSPSGRVYTHEELLKLGNGDGRLPVPNVAHFILPFGNSEMPFHHQVCILSCVWIMRPRLLFLWHTRLPTGQHWHLLRQNLTAAGLWNSTVVLARRDIPDSIYGLPVIKLEHISDLMRLEAILAFGGAYFDMDVITLKPLTPLRAFNFTIGRQSADGLCNAAILAAPNSTFVAMWHLAYQVFDKLKWSALSVNLPHFMCASAALKPLCHVEEDSMNRPTWDKFERDWIYERPRKWPWRQKNYVMHLWYRFHRVEYNTTSICAVDSMLGDMFRYVLFGNSSHCRPALISKVRA